MDVADDGGEFVMVYDEEPLLPMDMEVWEGAVLVLLAGGDDKEGELECALVPVVATWRR